MYTHNDFLIESAPHIYSCFQLSVPFIFPTTKVKPDVWNNYGFQTSDLCDNFTLYVLKKDVSYFYAVKWFQYIIVQFSDDYLDVVMNRDRHDVKFTHPPVPRWYWMY